jgi:hypothetical protein
MLTTTNNTFPIQNIELFQTIQEKIDEWKEENANGSFGKFYFCPSFQQDLWFDLDMVKIEEYFRYSLPKYIDEDKYYQISQRSWGNGRSIVLYINSREETKVIILEH